MASERRLPSAPPGRSALIESAHPALGVLEQQAALEVLQSGELVKGPRVAAFEAAFAARHGAAHGVATNSGATALSAALLAHELGPGDEVIVPSFGFFATIAAVLGVGATPVFADIDPVTYCLCPDAAARALTPRTRAVLPVHLFGLPASMSAFEALCRERQLILLEDAAQAHGATFEGRPVGGFGTAAFSFFATKNMTTLEGGMVLTSDARLARRLRMLRNHGRDASAAHELVGSNFRMTELAAAIGLVQLERLAGFNAARRANARYFSEHLRGVSTPSTPPDREHVFHQYTLRVPARERDELVSELNRQGIAARVYYRTPCHREPALAAHASARVAELPETERACREVLSLPVHPGLSDADRHTIVHAVNTALGAAR